VNGCPDPRKHGGTKKVGMAIANWPPVAVDEHGKDHLPQIRAMVLAVAVLAQRLPAGTLKVQTGGVHEHQVEPREQNAHYSVNHHTPSSLAA
jgi:hypothetical protein